MDPMSFYNLFAGAGFSRDFLFRVTSVNVGNTGLGKSAALFARAASFPGRTIEDKPISYFGVEYHMGGRAIYEAAGGYEIEFFADANIGTRLALEFASRAVFDNGKAGQGFDIDPMGSISMQVLNEGGGGGPTLTLEGASIRSIGPIQYLIGEGTGEIVTFTSTFAFQSFKSIVL